MHIISLHAENIKRLKAVHIAPDGALVEITGKNAAGKSSVLDSIMYAIGGKDQICEKPLRNGQKKGHIVCDLGELVVTRNFTESGSTLTVTDKDGVKQTSPQSILDRLTGKLSFDPLAFSRMESREQAATLKKLVGLDFTAIDTERQKAFERRTAFKRMLDEKNAQIKNLPHHQNVPAVEQSAADLVKEINVAIGKNRMIDAARAGIDQKESDGKAIATRLKAIAQDIEELCEQQAELENRQAKCIASVVQMKVDLGAMELGDVDAAQQKLADITAINAKIRDNAKRDEIVEHAENIEAEVEHLTERIKEIDQQKTNALANAPFPVPGLSFDESGVLLNGLPFAQSSAAEQLKTSVAIGLAGNPTLRVMLIRDGSLLDSDSLKIVAEMAAEKDSQIWIEKVSDGSNVGVVIEDGCVKE